MTVNEESRAALMISRAYSDNELPAFVVPAGQELQPISKEEFVCVYEEWNRLRRIRTRQQAIWSWIYIVIPLASMLATALWWRGR